MNDIAKQNVKDKMEKAFAHQVLTNTQGADLLGINACYISMIKNPAMWEKCPAHAWETVLAWINSGLDLRQYARKHGKEVAPEKTTVVEKKEDPQIFNRVKEESPEKEKKKEKVDETKYSVNLAEIGWVQGLAKQGKTVHQISKELKIYGLIVDKILQQTPVTKEEAMMDDLRNLSEQKVKTPHHEKTIVDIEINLTVNGKLVNIV